VVRVPLRSLGRFAFIASAATSVRRVRVLGEDPCPASRIRLCCPCLSTGIPELSRKFSWKNLWDFSSQSESRKQESCCVGLVHFDILRIDSIRLNLIPRVRDCGFCDVIEDEKHWTLEASAKVAVDDGTTEGFVVCDGFRITTELIGATQNECTSLKQLARIHRSVEINEDFLKTTFELHGRCAGTEISRESFEALEIASKLFSSCCRDVYGVVMNRTPLPFDAELSGAISETVVRSFGLGFGRKLWTATAPTTNRVELECVAVLEGSGRKGNVQGQGGRGNCVSSDVLRTCLAELEVERSVG